MGSEGTSLQFQISARLTEYAEETVDTAQNQ